MLRLHWYCAEVWKEMPSTSCMFRVGMNSTRNLAMEAVQYSTSATLVRVEYSTVLFCFVHDHHLVL